MKIKPIVIAASIALFSPVNFIAGVLLVSAGNVAAYTSHPHFHRDPAYNKDMSGFPRPTYPKTAYYRYDNDYRAAQDRCARRYRSYSYRTDTYTTYSGQKKLCPYIRPRH